MFVKEKAEYRVGATLMCVISILTHKEHFHFKQSNQIQKSDYIDVMAPSEYGFRTECYCLN